jgi:hypothetical protein
VLTGGRARSKRRRKFSTPDQAKLATIALPVTSSFPEFRLPFRIATSTWDRCYDCLNIFAKKMQKIGGFDSKQSKIMQKFYHNIGF